MRVVLTRKLADCVDGIELTGWRVGDVLELTEHDLEAVFPRETWTRRHLEIVLFGREHCPALRHDMTQCPICSWAATKKAIAENAEKKPAR